MSAQLPLDLKLRPALGRADFIVAASNAEALAAIDGWQLWPGGRMALVGPASAGKTHLASVWARASGGRLVAAGTLQAEAVPENAQGPLALEDIDRAVAGDAGREAALLHLFNALAEAGRPLLLTSRQPPARLPVALPDLASRLGAMALCRLAEPDDGLLAALLAKLFRDRQLRVHPGLVPFLVRRMERSGSAAEVLAARLDAAALGAHRPLTVPFARQVLGW
jgi:chromosomal replication initiation ATPase DnaA